MENIKEINYPQIIARDWRKVLIVTLVIILVALAFTLIQPFLYSATASILVTQKSGYSIDAYSALKSEERIADKLSQVVYSSSFLDKVVQSGFNVDADYFPTDEAKKRKVWENMIETSVPAGMSKLEIKVYHSDPNQALKISEAVVFVLTSEKDDYIGIEDVELRLLDAPLVSKYPVKPNVFWNMGLGIVLGIILGIAFVIITYNPERDKLFSIPEIKKKDEPVLVELDEVSESVSVEHAMAETEEIPEIGELEEVEELAEAEEEPEKPVESVKDLPESPLNEQSSAKEFPSFEEEEKIIGMPEK
ncbi:hypothetical protein KKC32_04720 [Patescibacteria group bacterium]|nr:hypothetical protein [Patescibacteria group bacterium]